MKKMEFDSAIILAAGIGSRLRSVTDIPKCLIKVKDKTLLENWIDACVDAGISNLIITTHYKHELIQKFISSRNWPINITLVNEEKLKGTAGSVMANLEFLTNNFIVIYSDNFSNIDLSNLINFHKNENSKFTVALTKTEFPKEKGIVELSKNNLIVNFIEKPKNPKSDLMNAGVYAINKEILRNFSDSSKTSEIFDFGYDVIPNLIFQMKGYKLPDNEFLRDVGLPKEYKKYDCSDSIIKDLLD